MSAHLLSSLLPQPAFAEARTGTLRLDTTVGVWASAGAERVAYLMQSELGRATGLTFVPAGSDEAQIVLRLDDDGRGPESYRLDIDDRRAVIAAPAPEGLVHGFYTLRQLLPDANWRSAPLPGVTWRLPACRIVDAPRFRWRGCMLDVSRHFAQKQTILRFIDLLSMHHFNRLHLHLSDDQGWRVEIKAFPKLAEVASHRTRTGLGFAQSTSEPHDGTPHGGYYTQDDLREIVAYAGARGITVVPEIDLPGHSRALIAAYPEYGCTPEQELEVSPIFGVSRDLVNPLPRTLAALETIFDELLAIFPSPWIHVGGDEAPLEPWRNSAEIRAYMESQGVASAEAMRTRFTAHLAAFLEARGRRLVGWDEIIHYGGMTPESVIMSWRGETSGIRAAAEGYDVIMAPVFPTYFDYAQDEGSDEPLAIGQATTLEDVYAYEPAARWPDKESFARVLGVQCQIWREVILDEQHLEYMAFPRVCAIAEVAWCAQRDDFAAFSERLTQHLARLDAYGVNYRPLAGPRPWQKGGTGRKAYQFRFNLKQALVAFDQMAESGEPPAEQLND